jgi:hypothetical protein
MKSGRHSLVAVYRANIIEIPQGWTEGPLPLQYGTIKADSQARGTYFRPECARILYGTARQPRRWHSVQRAHDATQPVIATELLVADADVGNRAAFAIFHLNVRPEMLHGLLRDLARRSQSAKVKLELSGHLEPWAALDLTAAPFTVAFLTSTDRHLPRPSSLSGVRSWTRPEEWLWLLASRSSQVDYPPDPQYASQLFGGTVVLSADWRCLVARDGAAFVGLRRDHGEQDPYFGYAQLYTHSTYLDALLLGMIQESHIETMTDASARAFEARDLAQNLRKLETSTARFRSIYWLRNNSSHGAANDILAAYQSQHHLPERFDMVTTEIADLSRMVQTNETQRVSAALGIITVVGLPLGTALGVLQTLRTSSPWDLVIGLGASLAVTGFLLLTRLGRLLIRTVRRLR